MTSVHRKNTVMPIGPLLRKEKITWEIGDKYRCFYQGAQSFRSSGAGEFVSIQIQHRCQREVRDTISDVRRTVPRSLTNLFFISAYLSINRYYQLEPMLDIFAYSQPMSTAIRRRRCILNSTEYPPWPASNVVSVIGMWKAKYFVRKTSMSVLRI